jgi:hypothetical protein
VGSVSSRRRAFNINKSRRQAAHDALAHLPEPGSGKTGSSGRRCAWMRVLHIHQVTAPRGRNCILSIEPLTCVHVSSTTERTTVTRCLCLTTFNNTGHPPPERYCPPLSVITFTSALCCLRSAPAQLEPRFLPASSAIKMSLEDSFRPE